MRANPLSLRRAGLATFGLAALAATPQAQLEIVLIGQTIEDVTMTPIGTVTQIRRAATNESGDSLAEVDTTGLSTSDELVFDGNAVALREGDPVSDPAGATVRDVESLKINDRGDQAYCLQLNGIPLSENEAIYLNGVKLIQEGESATVAGFAAGSVFVDFDDISLSNPDVGGDVYILGYTEVNEGGILLDGLLLIKASETGVVSSITTVLKEGDPFDMSMNATCPLPAVTVRSIDPGANRLDVTEDGSWIAGARLNGSSSNDYVVVVDGTIVAREGCASPAGPNYLNLLSPEVGIRGGGGTPDWVLGCTISGSTAQNLMIVKTGATFVRKGDTFPAINGTITNFGNGAVSIADDGDVVWYGEWSDPDPSLGAAIFKGQSPVVQKGQTTIDGSLVTNINDLENSYAFSPGGERVIFTGDLANGTDGCWSFGAGTPWAIFETGCGGSQGSLAHTGGTAILGDGFTLRMDNGQANNVLTLLFFANNAIIPGFDPLVDCGINWRGFGELVLSINPPNPVYVPTLFPAALWASGSPVDYFVDLTVPQDPTGLVGRTFYWQGVFFDTMGVAPAGEKFRLTNAIATTFGSL